MARPAGTYITTGAGAAEGQREDLTDFITNISYTETPVIASMGTTTASGILHEWQTDTLRAPAANTAVEGNDAEFSVPAKTGRPNNNCQILEETLVVSGTLDAVAKAGRRKESSYQLTKKLKEIARDLELAVLLESGSSADPRRMSGLEEFISTNDQALIGTPTLAETHIDDAMEDIWLEAGGHPEYRAVMGSFQKKKVTAFAGHSKTQLNIDLKEKKLINTISVYESDFGIVYCIPHQMMSANQATVRAGAGFDPSGRVFIYRPDLLKLAKLRPTKTEPLGKTGDNRKYQIICEVTLEVRQEVGCAKISGLATS